MLNLNKRSLKTLPLIYFFIIVINFVMVNMCFAKDINYKIKAESDGGYSLEIDLTKTILFSADGFFQTIKTRHIINLIGKGKDLSNRNHKGFFYGHNEVSSNSFEWDFGYAWVDIERKYLYLNFYWVSEPDGMRPSDLNGKYKITND